MISQLFPLNYVRSKSNRRLPYDKDVIEYLFVATGRPSFVFHSADVYVEFIIDFIIDKGVLSPHHLCKLIRVYGSDNSANTILICSGYQIIEAIQCEYINLHLNIQVYYRSCIYIITGLYVMFTYVYI